MDNFPDRRLCVINVSKGGVMIASDVAWANTSRERRRGLLGRSGLSNCEGIYLTPCEWIHTFGMKFPIDVAFLSADGQILVVHHSLKPYRLSRMVLRAQGVLELTAGTLLRSGTAVGDDVQFVGSATHDLMSL